MCVWRMLSTRSSDWDLTVNKASYWREKKRFRYLLHLQAVFVTLPHRCWLEMLGGQEHLREQTK